MKWINFVPISKLRTDFGIMRTITGNSLTGWEKNSDSRKWKIGTQSRSMIFTNVVEKDFGQIWRITYRFLEVMFPQHMWLPWKFNVVSRGKFRWSPKLSKNFVLSTNVWMSTCWEFVGPFKNLHKSKVFCLEEQSEGSNLLSWSLLLKKIHRWRWILFLHRKFAEIWE